MENKSGPKDVFLHIFSIITLYVSIGTLIALAFQYINVLIPDPLEANYYYISGIYSSIRWFISILIVVFPVYVWTVWFLNKGYSAVPERREMRSRKWLVYLTIFLAALIIVGDLVALVYNLLQGEFTSRFLLKVLAVFLVAGATFFYYLKDIKRSGASAMSSLMRMVAYVSMIAVAGAIVGGFFIVGSPTEERAYRFDDQRSQDLQIIQSNVVSFWQAKRVLPKNLDELTDDISGYQSPGDPETGIAYSYRVKDKMTFELCATFTKPSRDSMTTKAIPVYSDPYYAEENWQHDAGTKCFERTIDPDRYPPLEKPAVR